MFRIKIDLLKISQILTGIVATITFFTIALYLRLHPAFLWGWYLNEFDPYVRYFMTKVVYDLGILQGLSWWLSGGLYSLAQGLSNAYSIIAVHGITKFTNFWYPWGVNWATVLSPGVSVFGAIFHEIIGKFLGYSLLKSTILFPAVINALIIFAMFYLGWRLGKDKHLGLWIGLLSSIWCIYSMMIIQRGITGWFDDVAIFQFLAILGIVMFVESIYRSGLSRIPFLILTALLNGITVWVWGSYFYLINIYGIFVTIISLYILYKIIHREVYRIDFHKIYTTYIALYIGFSIFILITPRYSLHTFTSGLVALMHFGLVISTITYILTRLPTGTLMKYSHVIKFVISILVMFSIVIAILSQFGIIKSPIKITGKFLGTLSPIARSPITASVGEHQITGIDDTFNNLVFTFPFVIITLVYTFIELNPALLLLVLSSLFGVYFASSMAQLYMLLGIFWIPTTVYGLVRFSHDLLQFRNTIAYVLVLVMFILFILSQVFAFRYVLSYVSIPPQILSITEPPIATYDWIDVLNWIRYNLPENATILSWWDYGYWISIIGNRTSLADNSTINSTQIALIGKLFTLDISNYTLAVPEILKVLKQLGKPKYVLVFIPYIITTTENNPILCRGLTPCTILWQPHQINILRFGLSTKSIVPIPIYTSTLTGEKSWALKYCIAIPDNFFGLGVTGGDFQKSYWMARIAGYSDQYVFTKLFNIHSTLILIPGRLEIRIITPRSIRNALIYALMFNSEVLKKSPYVRYVCSNLSKIPDYKWIWIFNTVYRVSFEKGTLTIREDTLPIFVSESVSRQMSNPPPGFELIYVSKPMGWVLLYKINYTILEGLIKKVT